MSASAPRKILVSIDSSRQAEEALGYASAFLPTQGTKIVLFHVSNEIPEDLAEWKNGAGYSQDVQQAISAWQMKEKETLADFLEDRRRSLLQAGFPEQAVEVKIQPKMVGLARDIMEESKNGYCGVVLGRIGLSKIKDLVLGSIATKLVTKLSHAPVCVVGGSPLTGNILMAVDSSPWAMRCADHVARVMVQESSKVTLFHAVRSLDHREGHLGKFITPEGEKRLQKQAMDKMEDVFDRVVKRLLDAGADKNAINTRIATDALSRAEAIVREAKQGGYGAIVVGRRGVSAVEDFHMGRVSNKVVSLARDMAVWVVN